MDFSRGMLQVSRIVISGRNSPGLIEALFLGNETSQMIWSPSNKLRQLAHSITMLES